MLRIQLAAISGFLSVAFGAFGAHGLKQQLTPVAMDIYQTAVTYQMVHTLAALAVLLSPLLNEVWRKRAADAFLVGILLFSGSLYALALSSVSILGAITPIGGVCFLIGWACIVAATRGANNGR